MTGDPLNDALSLSLATTTQRHTLEEENTCGDLDASLEGLVGNKRGVGTVVLSARKQTRATVYPIRRGIGFVYG